MYPLKSSLSKTIVLEKASSFILSFIKTVAFLPGIKLPLQFYFRSLSVSTRTSCSEITYNCISGSVSTTQLGNIVDSGFTFNVERRKFHGN